MGLFSVPSCFGILGEEMAFLIENLGKSKVDLLGSVLLFFLLGPVSVRDQSFSSASQH